ncbi:hypothetical protein CBL_02936 [Carabus blaptoides fortunei]
MAMVSRVLISSEPVMAKDAIVNRKSKKSRKNSGVTEFHHWNISKKREQIFKTISSNNSFHLKLDEAKRTPNFTFDETRKIKNMCAKMVSCSRMQKTKAQSTAGWKKIEEDFNSDNAATFRSAAVLKKKCENLKKNCKRKYSDMKVYSKGTGGGQSKIVVFDAVEEQILEMIEPQTKDFSSLYDCDEEKEEENSRVQTVSDVAVSSDWASYTPRMLTAPVAGQLQVKKVYLNLCNNFTVQLTMIVFYNWLVKLIAHQKSKQIEDLKIEFLKVQKEQFMKEAELRMSFMKEEQALKIKLLEVQLEIEKKKLENIC